MIVHLYAICWNEMNVLGFFFRHYQPWVDRFVFFDDGSTDGTLDVLRSKSNVEVHPFVMGHPESFILSARMLQNQCWKQSRGVADWVIVTAIDEHLYHPRLIDYLAACKRLGITYIPALGFDMVTESLPAADEYLAATRTLGAPNHRLSKLRIFDPNAIDEVNFAVGGHRAFPTGRLVLPERDELLLLHYKQLGADYVRPRHAALAKRLRAHDVQKGWGSHFSWNAGQYQERLAALRKRLVDVADAGYRPWQDHREPRWWRSAFFDLPCRSDSRGKLIFMEANRHVPFPFNRLFVLCDTAQGTMRAEHAHRTCHQFIVCLTGSFAAELDDGRRRSRHILDDPTRGLYVPPMMWLALSDFSPNSVCAVLASDPYNEADYIRDKREFLALVRAGS